MQHLCTKICAWFSLPDTQGCCIGDLSIADGKVSELRGHSRILRCLRTAPKHRQQCLWTHLYWGHLRWEEKPDKTGSHVSSQCPAPLPYPSHEVQNDLASDILQLLWGRFHPGSLRNHSRPMEESQTCCQLWCKDFSYTCKNIHILVRWIFLKKYLRLRFLLIKLFSLMTLCNN